LPATGARGAITVQADFVPVVDAGGALEEVVVTFVDVTAVKAAERERAENAAKNRFLATMSHELRTPLNSVLGFAQLLRMRLDERLDEREAHYLDNIEVSGRHLLAVINDILDLTSAAGGDLDLALDEVDVTPVVEGVRADPRGAASAKGLDLSVASPAGTLVHAD